MTGLHLVLLLLLTLAPPTWAGLSPYSFGLGTGPGSTYITPSATPGAGAQSSKTLAVISPGQIFVSDLSGESARLLQARRETLKAQVDDLEASLRSLSQQGKVLSWEGLLQFTKNNPSITSQFTGISQAALQKAIDAGSLASFIHARLQAVEAQIEDSEQTLTSLENRLNATQRKLSELAAIDVLTQRDADLAHQALVNDFDATRTRNQIEAMQVFSESAMRIVGDVYKEYDQKVAEAQAALRDAEKTGSDKDIAQAQSTLDAAKTKQASVENERVLAHGLVGGLTAALGGSDIVGTAAAAAAGKQLTLELQQLINNSDWAKAHPEETKTLRNLLVTGMATAVGAAIGGGNGGFIASQGDRFNRQLHSAEITFIRKRAADYARLNGISVEEAERLLARGALFGVDADWQAAYSLYSADEMAAYKQASGWLQTQAKQAGFTFVNEQGQTQSAFTATGKQFLDETLFLKDTLLDERNRTFYASRAAIALREMGWRDVAKAAAGFGTSLPNGVDDALKSYAGLLKPETLARLTEAAKALASNPKETLDKLLNNAKGATQDVVLGTYLDWLQKDSKELGQRAGYVTGQTLVDAAAIGLGLGVVKNGGKVLDKTASLTDGFKTRISSDIALDGLLKKAGAFQADGTPYMNMAKLSQEQKEIAGVLLGSANGVGKIAEDASRLGRVAVGQTGIDDLYKVNRPGVDYIIVEYKFDGSGKSPNSLLGNDAKDGRQMSNDWLMGAETAKNRIFEATGGNKTETLRITDALGNGRVEKWLVVTDRFGGVSAYTLDKNGYMTPQQVSKVAGGIQ